MVFRIALVSGAAVFGRNMPITDAAAYAFAYNGPDHVVFRGRPFALKRAITNLIDNAVKYGRLPEVELHCLAQRILLIISDRGPGIPISERHRLFQPFQRPGDTNNGTGVGLGLAVSHGFLQAMGGDLSLEDTPGGGVTMVISVPVAERLTLDPGPGAARTHAPHPA